MFSDKVPDALSDDVIFLRRHTDSGVQVDFHRPWADYVAGFGDVGTGDVWLGLEELHQLTTTDSWGVSVYMGMKWGENLENSACSYVHYNSFTVGAETDDFPLGFGGYSSGSTEIDAAASIGMNGVPFSTYDRDNSNNANCVVPQETGGWWYNSDCDYVAPTSGVEGYYRRAERFYYEWRLTKRDESTVWI